MKHICPHCDNSFQSKVEYDNLGWHTSCPYCGGSFDIDYTKIDFGFDVDNDSLKLYAKDLSKDITANAGWNVNNHGGYFTLAVMGDLELIVCVNKYKDNEIPNGQYQIYIEVQDNNIDEIQKSWWLETKNLDLEELQKLLVSLLLSEWWD